LPSVDLPAAGFGPLFAFCGLFLAFAVHFLAGELRDPPAAARVRPADPANRKSARPQNRNP
jgi:hypothetical protein